MWDLLFVTIKYQSADSQSNAEFTLENFFVVVKCQCLMKLKKTYSMSQQFHYIVISSNNEHVCPERDSYSTFITGGERMLFLRQDVSHQKERVGKRKLLTAKPWCVSHMPCQVTGARHSLQCDYQGVQEQAKFIGEDRRQNYHRGYGGWGGINWKEISEIFLE